jgi:predicted ATP-binding protein involved in virulence
MTRQKQRTTEDQQRWQEQQAARTTALMEQLEAGIQAIQTSDDFKKYLAAAAHFHQYSYANVLLILAQRPDATRVAGYSAT